MVMNEIQTWAPPIGLGWSKWIDVVKYISQGSYTLEFKSLSQAKSTFTVEILEGGRTMPKTFVGPGNIRVTSSDCACVTRIRLKSHTVGQNVLILVKL